MSSRQANRVTGFSRVVEVDDAMCGLLNDVFPALGGTRAALRIEYVKDRSLAVYQVDLVVALTRDLAAATRVRVNWADFVRVVAASVELRADKELCDVIQAQDDKIPELPVLPFLVPPEVCSISFHIFDDAETDN